MEINIENALLVLKKYLEETQPEKYEHSIRVAKISKMLAQKWGASVSDAVIAGLLHDIGKSMERLQLLRFCAREGVPILDFELFDNEIALHGEVSAILFKKEFEGNDKQIEEISHAISSHVAGDISMGLLDKIIFIADNLESKKESDELLAKIESGQASLDYCVEEIIKQKIQRNEEKNKKRVKKGKQPFELNPLLYLANKGPAIIEDELVSQENRGDKTIKAREIDYER